MINFNCTICVLTENVFSAEPSIKEKRKTHVHRNAHISTLQRLKIGTNYPSQARLILCPIVRRRMLMIAGFISHIPWMGTMRPLFTLWRHQVEIWSFQNFVHFLYVLFLLLRPIGSFPSNSGMALRWIILGSS